MTSYLRYRQGENYPVHLTTWKYVLIDVSESEQEGHNPVNYRDDHEIIYDRIKEVKVGTLGKKKIALRCDVLFSSGSGETSGAQR